MNVVSERFISLAIACISASVSPRPSRNTASELPSSGREEKTSHCAIARRLNGWLMNRIRGEYLTAGSARKNLQENRCRQPLSRCSESPDKGFAGGLAVDRVRSGFYSYWVFCPS